MNGVGGRNLDGGGFPIMASNSVQPLNLASDEFPITGAR